MNLTSLLIKPTREGYAVELSYQAKDLAKDLTKPELKKLALKTLRDTLEQLENGKVEKGSNQGFRYTMKREELLVDRARVIRPDVENEGRDD